MARLRTVSWMTRLLIGGLLMAGAVQGAQAGTLKRSGGHKVSVLAQAGKRGGVRSHEVSVSRTHAAMGRSRKGQVAAAEGRPGHVKDRQGASHHRPSAVGRGKTVSAARSDAARRHGKVAGRRGVSGLKASAATGGRVHAVPARAVGMGKSAVLKKAENRHHYRARQQLSLSSRVSAGVQQVTFRAQTHLTQAASVDLPAVAPNGSLGEAAGLNRIPDPLALRSSVALVVDPVTGRILYDKNSSAVLPIASLTKLMTAMVVLDGGQPLDEKIRIEREDRDTERYSTSHLPVGTELTRAQAMQLALMSSENRAAHALARNYPGGVVAFVAAANRKARDIGMWDSVFLDPTGLSASNVSTARDLALLVARAAHYPEIRRFSVASQLQVRTVNGTRVFHTTNPLVGNEHWGLTVQKTGFINEAGNCVVMQARVNGKQMIIVLLDSQGRYSRVADANRIRRFLEG